MRPVFAAAGLVEDRVDDLSSGHGAYMGPGPFGATAHWVTGSLCCKLTTLHIAVGLGRRRRC